MTIERIVRAFAPTDPFAPRFIVQSPTLKPLDRAPASSGSPENEVCKLEWAGSNPGIYEKGLPPQLTNFTTDLQEDKSRRETKTSRVENPNDPAQYVEVERVKKAVMTDAQTGKEFTLRFADWDK